jgi:hypothetical protein
MVNGRLLRGRITPHNERFSPLIKIIKDSFVSQRTAFVSQEIRP